MQPILYVLLLFNILFNFGGVEGREASPGSLAIPSACHMVRPSFQQQEWFREKVFGGVVGVMTGVYILNSQLMWHRRQSRIGRVSARESILFL